MNTGSSSKQSHFVCVCAFEKLVELLSIFFQWFYYRKILFFKLTYYFVKEMYYGIWVSSVYQYNNKKKNWEKYTGEMIRRLLYLCIWKRSVIHNRDEKLRLLKACQVEWSIMGFLWSSFLDTEHPSKLYIAVQSHSHVQVCDPMHQQI